MNYQQLESLTYERQATFWAEAAQRRLTQHAVTNQTHRLRVWFGQRLIALGQSWSNRPSTPTLTTKTVAR